MQKEKFILDEENASINEAFPASNEDYIEDELNRNKINFDYIEQDGYFGYKFDSYDDMKYAEEIICSIVGDEYKSNKKDFIYLTTDLIESKLNEAKATHYGGGEETYYGGWGYLKWENWVEDDLEDYNGPVPYDEFFERVYDDGQVVDAAFEIYNSRSMSAQNKIARQWYKEYKSLFKDIINEKLELSEEDDEGPEHGYASIEDANRANEILAEMDDLNKFLETEDRRLLKLWYTDKKISNKEYNKQIDKLYKEIKEKKEILYKELCELVDKALKITKNESLIEAKETKYSYNFDSKVNYTDFIDKTVKNIVDEIESQGYDLQDYNNDDLENYVEEYIKNDVFSDSIEWYDVVDYIMNHYYKDSNRIDAYADVVIKVRYDIVNALEKFKNLKNESLTEDADKVNGDEEDLPIAELEEPIVVSTEVEEEPIPEEVIQNAHTGMIGDLIKQHFDLLDNYRSVIATLVTEDKEYTDQVVEILNSAMDEESIILGMLTKASELIDDKPQELMQQGEDKAEEIAAESEHPLDENLNKGENK